MVLDSTIPVKRRWSRSWSLVAVSGLVGLSVLVAGVGLRAWAAPVPAPTEPKKAEPKKEEPKKAPQQAPIRSTCCPTWTSSSRTCRAAPTPKNCSAYARR